MAYYEEFLRGSKQVGAPEKSYLYSRSADMSSQSQPLSGGQATFTPKSEAQMVDPSSAVAAGVSGAAMGGPATAGIMVGGQFLSQYMAQKAADERAKRERDMQIQQQYGENQNKGFQTLMDTYRGALR